MITACGCRGNLEHVSNGGKSITVGDHPPRWRPRAPAARRRAHAPAAPTAPRRVPGRRRGRTASPLRTSGPARRPPQQPPVTEAAALAARVPHRCSGNGNKNCPAPGPPHAGGGGDRRERHAQRHRRRHGGGMGTGTDGGTRGGTSYDVVVIGGGAGGLNAALVLARARRRVAVVDAGQPRNAPSPHMHSSSPGTGRPRSPCWRSGGPRSSGTEPSSSTAGWSRSKPPPRRLPRAAGRRGGAGRTPRRPRHRAARPPARHSRTARAVGRRRALLPVLPRLRGAGQAARGARGAPCSPSGRHC